jgi:hypothetical protein
MAYVPDVPDGCDRSDGCGGSASPLESGKLNSSATATKYAGFRGSMRGTWPTIIKCGDGSRSGHRLT